MPDTVEPATAVAAEDQLKDTIKGTVTAAAEKLFGAVSEDEIGDFFAKLRAAADSGNPPLVGNSIDFSVPASIYPGVSGYLAQQPGDDPVSPPILVGKSARSDTGSASADTMLVGFDLPFDNPFKKPESTGKKVEETLKLPEEKKKLQDTIGNTPMSDEERKAILSKIEQFELEGKQQGLSENEIAKTLKEIDLMLKEEEAALPLGARVTLAGQILEHCINPQSIDQGGHATCNVTTMEEHLYTSNPSKAAAVIRQVALKGYYEAPDGKRIVLDPESLRPDREARMGLVDGRRDYASQILQTTMLNNHFQRKNPPEYLKVVPPGNFAAFGDVVFDKYGNVIGPFEGITLSTMKEIGNQMFGDDDYIVDGCSFKSPQDLDKHLQKMKQEGDWPAVTNVFGGIHVVSVRDYNPETKKYTVSNQWGDSEDCELTAEELLQYIREVPAKYRG